MPDGVVTAIYIADEGGPVRELPLAYLQEGRGIVGDRYWQTRDFDRPDREAPSDVTLISREWIALAEKTTGVPIKPGEHRRNIETAGIDLLDLLGWRFRIGPFVECESVRLTNLCKFVADTSGNKTLVRGLKGRPGLRASVVRRGIIRRGDLIRRVRALMPEEEVTALREYQVTHNHVHGPSKRQAEWCPDCKRALEKANA